MKSGAKVLWCSAWRAFQTTLPLLSWWYGLAHRQRPIRRSDFDPIEHNHQPTRASFVYDPNPRSTTKEWTRKRKDWHKSRSRKESHLPSGESLSQGCYCEAYRGLKSIASAMRRNHWIRRRLALERWQFDRAYCPRLAGSNHFSYWTASC